MGKSIKEILEKLKKTKEEEKELKLFKQNLQDTVDDELYQKKKIFFENYSQSSISTNVAGAGGHKKTSTPIINPWIIIPGNGTGLSIINGTPTSFTIQQVNTEVDASLMYNPNLSYNDFDFVRVEFSMTPHGTNNVSAALGGVNPDLDSVQSISEIGGVVDGTTKRVDALMMIYSPSSVSHISAWGMYRLDFNFGAYTVDYFDIEVTNVYPLHPPAEWGISEDYETSLHGRNGIPDTEVIHANHTISWDVVGKRLKCVATGVGVSYMTWNFIKTGSDTITSYLTVSNMTASGEVALCNQLGQTAFSTKLTSDGTIARNDFTLSNPGTQMGISIETTGAGEVYIDKWCYASTSRIFDIT